MSTTFPPHHIHRLVPPRTANRKLICSVSVTTDKSGEDIGKWCKKIKLIHWSALCRFFFFKVPWLRCDFITRTRRRRRRRRKRRKKRGLLPQMGSPDTSCHSPAGWCKPFSRRALTGFNYRPTSDPDRLVTEHAGEVVGFAAKPLTAEAEWASLPFNLLSCGTSFFLRLMSNL